MDYVYLMVLSWHAEKLSGTNYLEEDVKVIYSTGN